MVLNGMSIVFDQCPYPTPRDVRCTFVVLLENFDIPAIGVRNALGSNTIDGPNQADHSSLHPLWQTSVFRKVFNPSKNGSNILGNYRSTR